MVVTIVKQFKFNEQMVIEAMIKSNFVDVNNVVNTIYSLAKYNYHVLHLKDKANYNRILKYITSNCENIYEEAIYADIEGCIKNAKKHTLATIDEVCITQSEMNVIRNLNDIKQEKAIFIILATVKYFNALNGKGYDAVFLTNSDICNLARITIPVKERDEFMQFAYDNGLLCRHTWADSIIKKVTFISRNENDKVALRLTESDFLDLAYTYLAYINPSQFRRCVSCGRWIRVRKQDKRLCRECRTKEPSEKDKIKTIRCDDCGELIYVSVLSTETCRCENCNSKHQKERNAAKNRAYRARKKNKSVTVAFDSCIVQN